MSELEVGFIGVGRMGGPLARRLINARFPLTVFDTNKAAVDSFVASGARPATSAAAVASLCAIVITCLPTPSIVHNVALGPETFHVQIPAGTTPMTIEELRNVGPLADRSKKTND